MLSVLMIFGASILGVLAYFSDETNEVTNTFTMGNVSFEDGEKGLDESLVDEYGRPIEIKDGNLVDAEGNFVDKEGKPSTVPVPGTPEDLRVTGNDYTLVPGKTYTKDPTLHIKKGSQPAYVYAKVVNGLAAVETDETIADQMVRLGWVNVDGNVWRYSPENKPEGEPVDARAKEVDVPVFETFTIDSTQDGSTAYDNVVVKGFAIQADGVDVKEADNEALKVLKP